MISQDFRGMLPDQVKKVTDYLDSTIKTEAKIDFNLNEEKDKALDAYKSSDNSSQLSNNLKQLSDSEYVKVRNLKSYKNYIEKTMFEYIKAGNTAENTINQVTNNLKK